MVNFYDEVEIEDMTWDADINAFTYPCPCGDRFLLTQEDLRNGEEVGRCPSCSLIIRVIYDDVDDLLARVGVREAVVVA